MKQLLITIAALVLVGCGKSQESITTQEAKPVDPVAETKKTEPPTLKAPDISIHEAVKEGNIEAVKKHLAAGTYINSRNSGNEWTPLHIASVQGNKKIAELLVAEGADVNARDRLSDRPLHNAVTYEYKGFVEFLISKGADVNAKNAAKHTPLHIVEEKDIAEILILNGADLNAKDVIGYTPLHKVRKKEIAGLLIKSGADVNSKDSRSDTPLHTADNAEVANLLLEMGANVNAENEDGETPLITYSMEIAELLISKGVDVNAVSDFEETALNFALREDLTELADLLRKHGGKTGEELKAERK